MQRWRHWGGLGIKPVHPNAWMIEGDWVKLESDDATPGQTRKRQAGEVPNEIRMADADMADQVRDTARKANWSQADGHYMGNNVWMAAFRCSARQAGEAQAH